MNKRKFDSTDAASSAERRRMKPSAEISHDRDATLIEEEEVDPNNAQMFLKKR